MLELLDPFTTFFEVACERRQFGEGIVALRFRGVQIALQAQQLLAEEAAVQVVRGGPPQRVQVRPGFGRGSFVVNGIQLINHGVDRTQAGNRASEVDVTGRRPGQLPLNCKDHVVRCGCRLIQAAAAVGADSLADGTAVRADHRQASQPGVRECVAIALRLTGRKKCDRGAVPGNQLRQLRGFEGAVHAHAARAEPSRLKLPVRIAEQDDAQIRRQGLGDLQQMGQPLVRAHCSDHCNREVAGRSRHGGGRERIDTVFENDAFERIAQYGSHNATHESAGHGAARGGPKEGKPLGAVVLPSPVGSADEIDVVQRDNVGKLEPLRQQLRRPPHCGHRAVRVQQARPAQHAVSQQAIEIARSDRNEQILARAFDHALVVRQVQQPVRRAARADIADQPIHPASIGRHQVHNAADRFFHAGRRRMWASCWLQK